MGYYIGFEGRQFYLEDDETIDFETGEKKKKQEIRVISPGGETMGRVKTKTYKCDVCEKEFGLAVSLAGHKRSHK